MEMAPLYEVGGEEEFCKAWALADGLVAEAANMAEKEPPVLLYWPGGEIEYETAAGEEELPLLRVVLRWKACS